MKFTLSLVTALLLFNGCTNTQNNVSPNKKKVTLAKNPVLLDVRNKEYRDPYLNTGTIYQNLNGAIDAIADELFSTISIKKRPSIILTSFVDLNQLNKTTTFGRLLSESMYNELHIRKFDITDFRGQDAVSVNADGEFHITRDVDKLKDHIESIEFVLVGTYVRFEEDSVLLNARIMDSESGKVISTARIIYKPKDCGLYNICKDNLSNGDGIHITTDNCSATSCPSKEMISGNIK